MKTEKKKHYALAWQRYGTEYDRAWAPVHSRARRKRMGSILFRLRRLQAWGDRLV